MTQDELDALPDVTRQVLPEERTINGRQVIVPVQQPGVGALFQGPEDGLFVCARTMKRYVVGWHDGRRVKRLSETWT